MDCSNNESVALQITKCRFAVLAQVPVNDMRRLFFKRPYAYSFDFYLRMTLALLHFDTLFLFAIYLWQSSLCMENKRTRRRRRRGRDSEGSKRPILRSIPSVLLSVLCSLENWTLIILDYERTYRPLDRSRSRERSSYQKRERRRGNSCHRWRAQSTSAGLQKLVFKFSTLPFTCRSSDSRGHYSPPRAHNSGSKLDLWDEDIAIQNQRIQRCRSPKSMYSQAW